MLCPFTDHTIIYLRKWKRTREEPSSSIKILNFHFLFIVLCLTCDINVGVIFYAEGFDTNLVICCFFLPNLHFCVYVCILV